MSMAKTRGKTRRMPHRTPKALVRVDKELANAMKVAAAMEGLAIYQCYNEAIMDWLRKKKTNFKNSRFCKTLAD